MLSLKHTHIMLFAQKLLPKISKGKCILSGNFCVRNFFAATNFSIDSFFNFQKLCAKLHDLSVAKFHSEYAYTHEIIENFRIPHNAQYNIQ